MHLRSFGGSSVPVSEVGLGTWQFGGTEWGNLDEADALATLRAAADAGITFLDTADIYGLGRSERLIGRFVRETPGYKPFIATKLGKNPDPGGDANFTLASFRKHTEASLQRLGVETLDLQQMHCVPLEQLQRGEVFDWLRTLQQEGKIQSWARASNRMKKRKCVSPTRAWRHYKSSLTFIAKSRSAICSTRQSARASQLSSGCRWRAAYCRDDTRKARHSPRPITARSIATARNSMLARRLRVCRSSAAWNLRTSLKTILPPGEMAQWALRWCLDFDAVTVVIPGAATRRKRAVTPPRVICRRCLRRRIGNCGSFTSRRWRG